MNVNIMEFGHLPLRKNLSLIAIIKENSPFCHKANTWQKNKTDFCASLLNL